ncbi:hypothetical protein EVA_03415 [gut metagenome]|uniref:Uncharacterized protein n=1 Tax=gut metagenome TaxID=749906 RepID=J9H423_9ZZZZ
MDQSAHQSLTALLQPDEGNTSHGLYTQTPLAIITDNKRSLLFIPDDLYNPH